MNEKRTIGINELFFQQINKALPLLVGRYREHNLFIKENIIPEGEVTEVFVCTAQKKG